MQQARLKIIYWDPFDTKRIMMLIIFHKMQLKIIFRDPFETKKKVILK